MNKKLKRKQALIMAEPYRTPFNSKVAKVSGDVIEDSVGGIKYATSFDGATKIVDANKNKIKIKDGVYTFGKSVNLAIFNDQTFTQNGVSVVIKEGVITFSGTATADTSMTFNFVSNVTETANDSYYWGAFNNKILDARFGIITNETSGSYTAYEDFTEVNKTRLFRNATAREIIAFFFNFSSGANLDGFELKPMLIQSETEPTKYYSGSYGIKIEVADGVMTCNGILASDSEQNWWYNFELPISSGIYSANMFLRSPNINVYLSQDLTDWDHSYQIAVKEAQTAPLSNINIKTDCTYMFFNFDREHDYENVILKPMLVLGTTAPTEFEPNFKNLLEIGDLSERTKEGLTYYYKNGMIVVNGASNGGYTHIYDNLLGAEDFEDGATYSFNDISNNNNLYLQFSLAKKDGTTQYLTKKNSFIWDSNIYSICYIAVQTAPTITTFNNIVIKPTLVKSSIIPTQFIPFANPYFISLGQNGSVQYNGLEPREIDLKGNVISKINNQASDKLSNYALTKNTKVVDLGSLTWEATDKTVNNKYRMSSQSLKSEIVYSSSSSSVGNIISTTYNSLSTNDTYLEKKGISLETDGTIKIYDPEYNTSDKLEAFKKAIRGTLLMYQVKNPTTINTTSFKTFKEDTNATISDDNFTSSPNAITETFKPTRSYDFKVNGFSNVVKSSNLLSLPDIEETTQSGVTYSIKNGVITLNGTTTDIFNFKLENVVKVEENQTYYLYQKTENTTATLSLVSNISNYGEEPTFFQYNNKSKKMTKTGYLTLHLYITNTTTFTNAKFYVMLVEGSTAPTTFEPYFDPYIESFADKKNLLDLSQISDIAFSTKDNQTITYNKDKNGAYFIKDYSLENGFYEVSLILKTKLSTQNSFNYIVSGTTQQSLFTEFQHLSLNEIHSKQIEVTENKLSIILWINGYQEFDFQMMIIKGKTAPTTFLPYQDKYSAFLDVKGKNLLEFDDVENAITFNGMTYSIKDGVITVNGTPTEISRGVEVYFKPININIGDTYSIALFNQFTSPVGFFVKDKSNDGNANKYLGIDKNIATTWTVEAGSQYEAIVFYLEPNKTYTNLVIKPILVSGSIIPTEYEPYYSFTKEVLIKQPLRKFDYLTYDGVYRQTNEIVLDGSWDVVDKDFLWEDGRFVLSKTNVFFPLINNWEQPFSQLYITTTSDLPLLPLIELQYNKKKGIALNDGSMIIKLDDSADNSLNNWTVEKINNYFKQNPITITYKTVDQTFEATSLTRLLFKNGYNKITAFDSINNNAIVEYLEYYKSKGD